MNTVGSATLTNRIWLALSWLLPAALIKLFILPDFKALHYFLVPDDVFCMYWNAVHGSNALLHNTDLFFTKSVLAPQGVSLLGHTYAPVFGLLNAVLDDAVLSINVAVYLNLLLFAAGIYALTSLWMQSPLNRLVVSILAVFNGYMLAKSGIHLNLLLLGLVPWTLLAFLKAFDNDAKLKNWGMLCIATGMLLLNVLFDYYAILYTVFFTFLWFVYQRFLSKILPKMKRRHWVWVGLGLLVSHVVSRLLNLKGLDTKGGIWEAPDIRAFLVPGPLGKWFGFEVQYPNSPETENFVYAGISLLMLLLVTVFFHVRNYRKADGATGLWLFLLLCFFAFTFPVIKIEGRNVWYWPNSLLHYIPGLQHFRSTGRMFELFMLSALVFSFVVLEKQSWRKPAFSLGLPLLFAAVLVFEHYAHPPKDLTKVALMPTEQDQVLLKNRTVLTLPWGIRDGFRMLGSYQVRDMKLIAVPGCKVCSGYISRISEKNLEYYKHADWAQSTLKLQNDSILGEEVALQWAKALNQSEINAIRAELGDAEMRKRFEAGWNALISEFGWKQTELAGVVYLIKPTI